MEKAILILDQPKNCLECPVGVNNSCIMELYISCGVAGRGAIGAEAKTIPEWCPLKPMPEKKNVTPDDTTGAVAVKFGWNNCIDEVLKGADHDRWENDSKTGED